LYPRERRPRLTNSTILDSSSTTSMLLTRCGPSSHLDGKPGKAGPSGGSPKESHAVTLGAPNLTAA
jgi:hypothetical protein